MKMTRRVADLYTKVVEHFQQLHRWDACVVLALLITTKEPCCSHLAPATRVGGETRGVSTLMRGQRMWGQQRRGQQRWGQQRRGQRTAEAGSADVGCRFVRQAVDETSMWHLLFDADEYEEEVEDAECHVGVGVVEFGAVLY